MRDEQPTVEQVPAADAATTAPVQWTPSAAESSPQQFTTGAIVGGRYRLIALLGRGGMGDVYRADDLTLDQGVALKFLPAGVAADATRLAAFHNELRMARRVSHKNVCRLHDLGEANGRRFLTMEYVDGEDLGSLLRRVGRIPEERGLQMARQLCAGVAAAHEQGVVHRDLKPANVMIDSGGDVRITDFGIATTGDARDQGMAGTLHYMAPEQFSGAPASTATDIYALGLILFELFTGRRAVEGARLADIQAFHHANTMPTPTTIVRDLDPAIDRIIMRCLARDPARRPGSALAVAAALPGGDPLAAALAAGETPSPALLAAAGQSDALPIRTGLALAAAALLGVVAFALISPRFSITGRVPLAEPPAVLVDRAEQILATFGYPETSLDSAFDFDRDYDYSRWLIRTQRTPARWDVVTTGEPPAVVFWYRTSRRPLQPHTDWRITQNDPPMTETGMRRVLLDGQGRLREFRSVPPPRSGPPASDTADALWPKAFAAAGLDIAAFSSAVPAMTPPDFADTRAAWSGELPGHPGVPVKVEANAYEGRLVSFEVIGPWTRPAVALPFQSSPIDRAIGAVGTVFICGVFLAAVLLARRNLLSDRADRRGATRIAVAMATLTVLAWLFGAHHTLGIEFEFGSLLRAGSEGLLITGIAWLLYVALERYVRRFWPDSLLGWSRLLAGYIRDPRVGRDVLIGATAGTAVSLIAVARSAAMIAAGYPAPSPTFADAVQAFSGPGHLIALWLQAAFGAIEAALLFLMVVVLIKLAIKNHILGALLSGVVFSLPYMTEAGTTSTVTILGFAFLSGAVLTWVVFRAGVLALAIAFLVSIIAMNVPMMPALTGWAAGAGLWTLALIAALVGFGFFASRAGQPLLGIPLGD